MLVIPWWHLYPWWPFVAFSSLLWPVGVFAWWFVVQSATSMDTAVFCGICDNYGIYGGTVGLQCISNLFLVIFTPRRGFSAKFGCFGWKVIFSNIAISISAATHPCFKHAVSHVARVCAFGHWNPSSRTPLIMCVCVFGEFDQSFCRWFWLWTWLERIVKSIGIWILNETSGGQPVALGSSVFGLHFWDSIDHFCFWWLLRLQGEILWKC